MHSSFLYLAHSAATPLCQQKVALYNTLLHFSLRAFSTFPHHFPSLFSSTVFGVTPPDTTVLCSTCSRESLFPWKRGCESLSPINGPSIAWLHRHLEQSRVCHRLVFTASLFFSSACYSTITSSFVKKWGPATPPFISFIVTFSNYTSSAAPRYMLRIPRTGALSMRIHYNFQSTQLSIPASILELGASVHHSHSEMLLMKRSKWSLSPCVWMSAGKPHNNTCAVFGDVMSNLSGPPLSGKWLHYKNDFFGGIAKTEIKVVRMVFFSSYSLQVKRAVQCDDRNKAERLIELRMPRSIREMLRSPRALR